MAMAWTETTWRHYVRRSQRYVKDCSDAEWTLIASFLLTPKRLSVVVAAQRLSTTFDGAARLLCVARQRALDDDSLPPGHGRPRS